MTHASPCNLSLQPRHPMTIQGACIHPATEIHNHRRLPTGKHLSHRPSQTSWYEPKIAENPKVLRSIKKTLKRKWKFHRMSQYHWGCGRKASLCANYHLVCFLLNSDAATAVPQVRWAQQSDTWQNDQEVFPINPKTQSAVVINNHIIVFFIIINNNNTNEAHVSYMIIDIYVIHVTFPYKTLDPRSSFLCL